MVKMYGQNVSAAGQENYLKVRVAQPEAEKARHEQHLMERFAR